MKIWAIVMMAMLASGSVQARNAKPTEKDRVGVCMNQLGDFATTALAQAVASQMFKDIGVTLKFHDSSRSCPAEAIRISLTEDTPASLLPGALAFALPHEKTHLRIFLDRVQNAVEARRVPYLLAHVLVHELTHLIQGINRHSDSGVMKAKWDEGDYAQIGTRRLAFTENDVRLIRRGLEARSLRAVLAKP